MAYMNPTSVGYKQTNFLIDNDNKCPIIYKCTFAYNPLRLRHVSIFFRSLSGSFIQTSTLNNSSVLFVFYISLFDVKLPEEDLKKVEICRGLSGLYVNVYVLILGHFSWAGIAQSV